MHVTLNARRVPYHGLGEGEKPAKICQPLYPTISPTTMEVEVKTWETKITSKRIVCFTIRLSFPLIFHFHEPRSLYTQNLCRCSVLAAANPVFGNFDPSLDLVGKPLEKDGEDGKMQLSLYHSVSKLDVSRCMIPNDSFKESQGYFCVIHLMYQWGL